MKFYVQFNYIGSAILNVGMENVFDISDSKKGFKKSSSIFIAETAWWWYDHSVLKHLPAQWRRFQVCFKYKF